MILFLVDGSEPAGKGDKWIAENIVSKIKSPVILVMNKIDKVKSEEKINENKITYENLFNENKPFIIQLSAKTGNNKENLLKEIFAKLPYGDMFYPEDTVTEESMRDVTQEIIREKILLNTKEEVPHCVAVLVDKYEEKDNIDKIYATIYCETKSQKGILIGKGGSLLKKIGTDARIELEKITEKKVYLELTVKIEKDWRKNKNALKMFGYFEE